jgi:hypothetical protein
VRRVKCQTGGVGFGHGSGDSADMGDDVVGTAPSADTFMARARACGSTATARGAMWRRRADERAWRGEREADTWDPAQQFSKFKTLLDENSSKQIARS